LDRNSALGEIPFAQIDVIQVGPLGTNCYVIHSGAGMDCVVVDPGGDSARIIAYLKHLNVTPSQNVATHAHADHTGAVAPLAKHYGSKFLIGQADAQAATEQSQMLIDMLGDFEQPPTPSQLLLGGETLEVDGVTIEILSNPGHTQGSISLHVDGHVLTGDTLFYESIGRYDLPGGDGEQEIESIKNVLLVLDDDTIVLPGHGQSTTIGHEKARNPYLR
jgi:hydroxyacylglutathione hydrolase